MELNFRINNITCVTEDKSTLRWRDSIIIEKIIDSFLKNELIRFRYFWMDDQFIELDRTVSLSKNIGEISQKGECLFMLTKDADIGSNYARFYFIEEIVSVDFAVDLDFKLNQLTSLRQLACNIFNEIHEHALFGPIFTIEVQDASFPRLRPIRDYQSLRKRALVNFFDQGYLNSTDDSDLQESKKLLSLSLPQNVTLERNNGLYSLQWTDRLASEQQIFDVLMNREKFLYENIDLEPINGFNEFGDKCLFNVSQLTKAPKGENFFNFYDKGNGVAFKLLTLTSEFELNEDVTDEIKIKLKKKKLSNDDPLNNIILIFPGRKEALITEEKALSIGIYKVFYLDNDANVWDLRPVGDWRN